MRSFNNKTINRKVKAEFDKNYDELYYTAFTESAPDVMRQTMAVMLFALSLHGYGKIRLEQIVEWTKDLLNMPGYMGKTPQCDDCVNAIKTKYGIDLSSIKPKIETWEEYKKK